MFDNLLRGEGDLRGQVRTHKKFFYLYFFKFDKHLAKIRVYTYRRNGAKNFLYNLQSVNDIDV